jgi:hypothetical protein
MKRSVDSRWFARQLPWFMILAVAFLAILGLARLASGIGVQEKPKTPIPVDRAESVQTDALQAQIDNLKSKADELKSNEDDLKWILGLILGASALFAIAQGIFAAFSARSFTDEAERMLVHAKAQLSSFTMMETRMTAANNSRANLQHSLESNSPIHDADEGFSWSRRLYEEAPLQTRQEILSNETFIPYVISGETDQRPVYAQMLRYLAQFYWSKFVCDRTFGPGQIEDLERAEYHLELAMQRSGQSFFLLNDMGNIQIEYHKALSKSGQSGPEYEALLTRFKDRAILKLKQSISVQKEQLRAYYNLAFVEADLAQAQEREPLERALKYLHEGLKYPNWERKPVPEYTCYAHYLVACYNGRLLAPQVLNKLAADQRAKVKAKHRINCLKALEEAAKIGMISEALVNEDFDQEARGKPGDPNSVKAGDLYWFARPGPPETEEDFSTLKHGLSSSYRA